MANQRYFWVNQGGTHSDEVSAGCLWAPQRDATGSKLLHWESMTRVQPGDIIFAYANNNVRGYAVATSAAAPMARPYTSGSQYSPAQGGRIVFCEYHIAGVPISFASVAANSTLTHELATGLNAVLNSAGKVAQKYLCEITATAATSLAHLCGLAGIGQIQGGATTPIAKTTVLQLIDARLGQGKFKDDLIAEFGGRCSLTGLAERSLLRASHLRPWCESSNQERLDPENGLLLAAGIDAAFDRGFVGFDGVGTLLVKQGFSQSDLVALGFPPQTSIDARFLTPARLKHLAYHRTKFNL